MSVNLSRRNSLKTIGAAFCVPFFMKMNLFAAENATKNFKIIKDGEVITGAHWGVLNLP